MLAIRTDQMRVLDQERLRQFEKPDDSAYPYTMLPAAKALVRIEV
jgi:hypothetical protein